MSRITISLPQDLSERLSREARRRGVSVSEVVRAAVSKQLGLFDAQDKKLSFIGVGRSGRRHTARDAEKILTREWGHAGDR
ncbi:MAG: CopG family transcriptional regulator [Myxococcaceae bacterium]